MIRTSPSPALRGKVSSYYGFREETACSMRRREGPGVDAIVLVSFGEAWTIDGARLESFVAGLYDRQVTTEHDGRSHGMQIDLAPQAAHALFREPMHTLARRTVPLEDVLSEWRLAERIHDLGSWPARFALLDELLTRRLANTTPPSSGVVWAWRRLVQSGGRARIGSVAEELGWSRKRIVARFREEVGLTPKEAARIIRFDRVLSCAEREERPDWARIALACGYYDQAHLSNEFRAVTGRPTATFFQDEQAGVGVASAA